MYASVQAFSMLPLVSGSYKFVLRYLLYVEVVLFPPCVPKGSGHPPFFVYFLFSSIPQSGVGDFFPFSYLPFWYTWLVLTPPFTGPFQGGVEGDWPKPFSCESIPPFPPSRAFVQFERGYFPLQYPPSSNLFSSLSTGFFVPLPTRCVFLVTGKFASI